MMPDNRYPNYNPIGALNNTFAPAYIPGYAPSEQAVMDRQATRGRQGIMNQGVMYLEDLRAPAPPRGSLGNFTTGAYDPNMLRAMAQNLPYDVPRRRSEIAGILAARAAQAQTDPLQQYLQQQQLLNQQQINPSLNFPTNVGA
jgi:hypothetical protein